MNNTTQITVCDYLANLVANSINEQLNFTEQLSMPITASDEEATTIIERSYESQDTTLYIALNMLSRNIIKLEYHNRRQKSKHTTVIDTKDLSDHNKIVRHIETYAEHLLKTHNNRVR